MALGIAWLASAPAGADGFAVTSADRHVDVAITERLLQCIPLAGCTDVEPPTDHSASESAPDLAPFVATASVPLFPGFSASQSSSLAPGSLRAQGSGLHTGSGESVPPPAYALYRVTTGSSESHFEAHFDVAETTAYRLRGQVSASGGLSANSTARIRLRTAGGSILAEVVAATDPQCEMPECAVIGPVPVDQTGVLAPGSYVLEAGTAGSAEPFFFAESYQTLASTGAYQVELAMPAVPTLGRGALAGLALALFLAALPLLRRAAVAHRAG